MEMLRWEALCLVGVGGGILVAWLFRKHEYHEDRVYWAWVPFSAGSQPDENGRLGKMRPVVIWADPKNENSKRMTPDLAAHLPPGSDMVVVCQSTSIHADDKRYGRPGYTPIGRGPWDPKTEAMIDHQQFLIIPRKWVVWSKGDWSAPPAWAGIRASLLSNPPPRAPQVRDMYPPDDQTEQQLSPRPNHLFRFGGWVAVGSALVFFALIAGIRIPTWTGDSQPSGPRTAMTDARPDGCWHRSPEPLGGTTYPSLSVQFDGTTGPNSHHMPCTTTVTVDPAWQTVDLVFGVGDSSESKQPMRWVVTLDGQPSFDQAAPRGTAQKTTVDVTGHHTLQVTIPEQAQPTALTTWTGVLAQIVSHDASGVTGGSATSAPRTVRQPRTEDIKPENDCLSPYSEVHLGGTSSPGFAGHKASTEYDAHLPCTTTITIDPAWRTVDLTFGAGDSSRSTQPMRWVVTLDGQPVYDQAAPPGTAQKTTVDVAGHHTLQVTIPKQTQPKEVWWAVLPLPVAKP